MERKSLSASQKMLKTKHINAALRLIGKQFPTIGGLLCPTHGATVSYPSLSSVKKWIQIIHDGSDHWLLAAYGFIDGNLRVFDSLSFVPTRRKHVIACLSSLYVTEKDAIEYIVNSNQKQENCFDCGVFAIAFATSLVFGQNPSDLDYDSMQIRSHLIQCFKNDELSPFPSKARSVPFSPINGKKLSYPVHCHCRRIDLRLCKKWEMIQCSGCKRWIHAMCDKAPPTFPFRKKWYCKHCVNPTPME